MASPVYTRPEDLSHLLDHFLARVLIGDSPINRENIAPHQLELAVKQDDLSIRVCEEGEWRDAFPPWYDAKIRREQGFTPDYLQQISAAAEQATDWKTRQGTPALAHEYCRFLFSSQVYFFEVIREPERILFTFLGYLLYGKKESLPREPLRLHNSAEQDIYPQ